MSLTLLTDNQSEAPLIYGDLILIFKKKISNSLYIPVIYSLTKAGVELSELITIKPNIEYIKSFVNTLSSESYKVFYAPIIESKGEAYTCGETVDLN